MIQIESQTAGNTFFARRLRGFTKLGLPYDTFWQKAYVDFERFQVGGADQSLIHCRDVEANLWKLLIRHSKIVPNEVLYILSLAAALHDLGKTGEDAVDPHGAIAAGVIRDKLVTLGYVQAQSTADAIADIVAAHDMGAFSTVPSTTYVGPGDVRIFLKACAAVFRLADMMSTREDRAARIHHLMNLQAPRLNQFLNRVRLAIRSCDICTDDPTTIDIRAEISDTDIADSVHVYVKGLNRDLNEEHRRLLRDIHVEYLTRGLTRKEERFSLPDRFALVEIASTVPSRNPIAPSRPRSPRHPTFNHIPRDRLVPCYFLSSQTEVTVFTELYDCVVHRRLLDPWFLYWPMRGTQDYLSLSRNVHYRLPDVALHHLVDAREEIVRSLSGAPGGHHMRLISLGVGTAEETNVLIGALSNGLSTGGAVYCVLVDFSYHMLRVAVNTIESTHYQDSWYRNNVRLLCINGDIRDLQLFDDIINHSEDQRLFTFLGGTLGNYREQEILGPIVQALGPNDYLLLGAELIGGRDDAALCAAYDSLFNRRFLHRPLELLGFEFDACEFRVFVDQRISEVDRARTIVSAFSIPDGSEVRVALSSKYVLEDLIKFLGDRFGLVRVLATVNAEGTYGLLLLRKPG